MSDIIIKKINIKDCDEDGRITEFSENPWQVKTDSFVMQMTHRFRVGGLKAVSLPEFATLVHRA